MKKLLLYICATVVNVFLVAQSLNPVAQFTFDSTIIESVSGLVPDSSNANYIYDNDEVGAPNSAINLSSGYLLMPDPIFTQFGLNDFSMSVWFRRTASLWPTEWILTKNSQNGYFRFRYNGFFDQMNFYFRPTMDSSEFAVGTASQTVGTAWNLYTITIDRDSIMSMFLNANQVFATDISNVETFPANFLGGDFRFGTGDIMLNDLAFFDKALSPSEVSAIYNNELSVDEPVSQSIIIYPNPTHAIIRIKSTHGLNKPYIIYSITGNIIQSGMVLNNEINIADVSSGQYILNLAEHNFSIIIR